MILDSYKNTQSVISPLPDLINDILRRSGLIESEIASYSIDRVMIAKYLKPTAHVLEIGSRPSVSIFVELYKADNAKHIVVDNDVGDRDRLNQLIDTNGMTLKVMPIDEFVDIYSYDAVIIEESEGDTAEILRDLPLDKIGIIITSEMGTNDKSRSEVESTLVEQGYKKTASASEITNDGDERIVDVYEKLSIVPIVEESVLELEPIPCEDVTPVTEETAPITIESTSTTKELTIEVREKEKEIITPPNTSHVSVSPPRNVNAQFPVARRFVGRRRPTMRMGL